MAANWGQFANQHSISDTGLWIESTFWQNNNSSFCCCNVTTIKQCQLNRHNHRFSKRRSTFTSTKFEQFGIYNEASKWRLPSVKKWNLFESQIESAGVVIDGLFNFSIFVASHKVRLENLRRRKRRIARFFKSFLFGQQ